MASACASPSKPMRNAGRLRLRVATSGTGAVTTMPMRSPIQNCMTLYQNSPPGSSPRPAKSATNATARPPHASAAVTTSVDASRSDARSGSIRSTRVSNAVTPAYDAASSCDAAINSGNGAGAPRTRNSAASAATNSHGASRRPRRRRNATERPGGGFHGVIANAATGSMKLTQSSATYSTTYAAATAADRQRGAQAGGPGAEAPAEAGASARRLARKRIGHERPEHVEVERLREVMVEARFLRAPLVLALAPSGDRHQHHRAAPVRGADRARHVVAVVLRHADIEKRDVRTKRFCLDERPRAIVGDAHIVAVEREQRREARCGVAVVVGNKNAGTARVGCCRVVIAARRGVRRIAGQRQAYGESRPVTGARAVRFDMVAVELDQALHQGEPDAEPAFGAIERTLHLGEHFEYPRQQRGLDADPAVLHVDPDLVDFARRGKFDDAARFRILGGIGEQVGKNLCEAHRIGVEQDRGSGKILDHGLAALVDERADGFQRHRDDGTEIDACAAQLELAARDARHVEQVVEQQRHVLHLPLDHLLAPAALRIARVRGARQPRCLADGGERIAQLVRERRQKLVLAPVGVTQCIGGFDELSDIGAAADGTQELA